MGHFLTKNNFPSFKTFALFFIMGCLLCGVIFYFYPWFVGQTAAWAFGRDEIPLFLASHPAVYEGVQGGLRVLYVWLSLVSFDFFLLLLLYRFLDELVTRQGIVLGLFAVAWRAIKPLAFLQLLGICFLCLLFGWIKSFSALSLLPVFFSASIGVSLATAVWVVSTTLFGYAYAVTEKTSTALVKSRSLLGDCLGFWVGFGTTVFLTSWLPAYVFLKMGVSGEWGLSLFYLVFGMFNQLLVWSLFLSWLLRNPDVLAVD